MATILVVDESPINRKFLTTLLGNGGHRVLEAADGAEALAIARSEYPDLVFADVLMPTMDGPELVRQLRADPASAHTHVIFLTDIQRHTAELERKVAERQQAQAALVESDTRNQAILESAVDGIITINREGLIGEFNPAAERIFGYRRDEVLGKALADLVIPPSLRDRHQRAFSRAVAT